MKIALSIYKAKDITSSFHLRVALKELRQQAKKEQGMVKYEIYHSEVDTDIFVLRESWLSEFAYQNHFKSLRRQKFQEEVPGWLSEPLELIFLKEL